RAKVDRATRREHHPRLDREGRRSRAVGARTKGHRTSLHGTIREQGNRDLRHRDTRNPRWEREAEAWRSEWDPDRQTQIRDRDLRHRNAGQARREREAEARRSKRDPDREAQIRDWNLRDGNRRQPRWKWHLEQNLWEVTHAASGGDRPVRARHAGH